MLQKSYRITSSKAYDAMVAEIKALPEYQSCEDCLAVVLYETWDTDELAQNAKQLKQDIPKAKIAGSCNGNEYVTFHPEEKKVYGDGSTYSFLFFDQAAFSILKYKEVSDPAALGNQFATDMSGIPDAKAAIMLIADPFLPSDPFFMAIGGSKDDYPIFGIKSGSAFLYFDPEQHASTGLSLTDLMNGYVFDENGIYANGVFFIVFSGSSLHAKASYNFGWTPIGKKMTITKTYGGTAAVEIDGEPAVAVYKKYLDLAQDQIIASNISEFPLITEKNGRTRARIGSNGQVPGSLDFFSSISEGDEIQFSYGHESRIFEETYKDACDYADFFPDAMFITPCINRYMLLHEREQAEIDFYMDVHRQTMVLRGFGEILRDSTAGDIYNSALVALALREGDIPEDAAAASVSYDQAAIHSKSIPIVARLTTFLEQATTELVELAEQANAANRAKSAFLSNMSHEIRTPINAILGLDEMILKESSENHIKEYASDLSVSGKHLLGIINDVLDISRLESGRMEIIPEEYELSSTINNLNNLGNYSKGDKDIDFILDIDPTIPSCLYGDEVRVNQCISNLLGNAMKYTKKGTVTLSIQGEPLDQDNVRLTVHVKDTGRGIKPEDMEKLTRPFERIDEKVSRSIEGSGLGLSIVTQLLTLMGSTLNVESKYGIGSDFSFSIVQGVRNHTPIGDCNEKYRSSAVTVSEDEDFISPEAKILVCDDNEMNLIVFEGLLRDTKAAITAVDSGQAAIDAVQKEAYDIIFLDQRMPGMTGSETLKKMKELPANLSKDAPVIILTATALSGAREAFLAEGFDDYLSKPVGGPKLKSMVRAYLPKALVQPAE